MYSWEWEEKNAKEEYSIKSFQYIIDFWNKNGPFHGFLGFSQGGGVL